MQAITIIAIAFVLAISLAAPAAAHGVNDPRHVAMTGLGKDMKAIGQSVQAKTPPSANIIAATQRIRDTAGRLLDLFPPGSGGGKSRAKPEIWQDWDGFRAANDRFTAAAKALVAAGRGGQIEAVQAALTATGKTCKGCHQAYRKPKTQ